MNMKTRTKMILAALITLLISSTAMGFDSATPYTVTMNFIVPSDSTFTVTMAGSETSIDFNPQSGNSKCVEPDSQVNASSIPILNITNGGNTNVNYGINVTTGTPSWVTLKASNIALSCSTGSTVNTSVIWQNWNTTTPGSKVDVYLHANFTSATAGSTAKTFQINAQ